MFSTAMQAMISSFGDSPNLFKTAAGGDDTLTGGTGNDTLWGDGLLLDEASGGADWFVLDANDGQDVIMDFRRSDGDKIVFDPSAFGWALLDTNGNGTLDGSDAHIQIVGGSTLIDLGAASGSDPGTHTLLIDGVAGLDESDFMFL